MRSSLLYLVVAFCLCSLHAIGQRKPKVHHGGRTTKSITRHNYNVIKVSRSKAQIVCPVFQDSGFPYQGIGLKLGDPFALTYKFYFNKKFSVALDGGKAASGLYNSYYRSIFREGFKNDSLEYLTHKANSDWVVEGKALYSFSADKISPGLKVYVGAGWQWKQSAIKYEYLNTNDGDGDPDTGNLERSVYNRSTMGPLGVLGIEYSYFKMPISAFMELEFYTDVVKDPGYRRLQGGVGLRYVF
ncbi:MAG: hypothetical protein L0Y35_03995 [Flammeovirgaceae bacterium]|nr:hypothetical protein [Flammeovirgaceae bacterium]